MSNEVDIVENGAIVKVFLLEAPLPSNAGDDIMSGAGPFWEGYGKRRRVSISKYIEVVIGSTRR